jgi:hypothetical protein
MALTRHPACSAGQVVVVLWPWLGDVYFLKRLYINVVCLGYSIRREHLRCFGHLSSLARQRGQRRIERQSPTFRWATSLCEAIAGTLGIQVRSHRVHIHLSAASD